MGVTNKYRSSILLEAVSPKYKRSASVWIVCNTYESFPPRIEHSTDRRTAIYCQILLDTDESPTLTLVRVLYHIPTGAELATSTIYIYSGHRYGACVPKAVYCFGFVSGGCVDDTAVAFQRYEDGKVNYSHRWDRGIYFISGTASTKFKFESSLKAATTVRTRVSPIISAHSLCLTPFFSNRSTRRVCEVVCSTYESLPPVIKQSTYRRMALISDTLLVR